MKIRKIVARITQLINHRGHRGNTEYTERVLFFSPLCAYFAFSLLRNRYYSDFFLLFVVKKHMPRKSILVVNSL
jgi:hypothetical protein